ncbi:hypothetical protein G6M89_10745 [Natronolimnobius sp. AArcel1]|uniref:hypothetical protein n=1 Tax=Natronolimnobius sp. AArcel1 TaxID=1679093 RepID=UPI0013EA4F16|nr:hypothetical protein [Natronolimnobius sp. AArcel1]NGM69477.1 hypothetical protein [Natronolimnobius sp. AArcel1]
MLPESPQARFRWALTESLIIFGLFAVWALIVASVRFLSQLVIALSHSFIGPLHPLFELLNATSRLWTVVVPVAAITASLYVLVRAGTLLIDHYVETADNSS